MSKDVQPRSRVKRTGLFSTGFAASPIAVLIGLLIVAVYPLGVGSNQQVLLSEFAIYFMWITLAVSWNLVGGYAGLLNLGFAGFFVLGTATAYSALKIGMNLPMAFLLAGLSGAALSILLIPTFRLRSDYFAIGTLVIPLMLEPVANLVFGSNYILPHNQTPSPATLYYVGLLIATLTIFGCLFLIRSRIGMALRAIGNDEYASSSLGVNTLLYKTIAVVVGGFIASVAGAYYMYYLGSVSSTNFENLTFSLYPIFMVIIGGIATFEGPIAGALIFSGISYAGATLFPGSTLDTPLFSIIIMIVAVLLPIGIVPTVTRLLKSLFRIISIRV